VRSCARRKPSRYAGEHEIVMILAVTTDGLRNVETSEVTLGAGAT
jgi:hypothetical protein